MVSHFCTIINEDQHVDNWFDNQHNLTIIHSLQNKCRYTALGIYLILLSMSVRYGKGEFLYMQVLVCTGKYLVNSFLFCLVLITGGDVVFRVKSLLQAALENSRAAV